ncbi:MAG: hypothetical protein H0U76_24780 [Ktedonobacteraceae bacterium]|nr:hypothetical protein [Ktedonobacteraceae bacterium]
MTGIATPERVIDGETVKVEADDNIALILDHGNAIFSVIQTGFVYGAQREDWTIQIIGIGGAMTMGSYDWDPKDVALYSGDPTKTSGEWSAIPQDKESYAWEGGATYIAECLAQGKKPVLTGEHAVHVFEIMQSALQSSASGQRVRIESTFPWPLIS